MSAVKEVVIYSDGACHGNPGPGGWAAVLSYKGRVREISGGSPATTNNRMELQAAVEALNALKEPCEVTFYTDSKYVQDGIKGWLSGWKRNGWRTKKGPVKNQDLWRALDEAVQRHRIQWRWVKGHAGDHGNERCDALATIEVKKIKKQYGRTELDRMLEEFKADAKAQAKVGQQVSDLFSDSGDGRAAG